MKVTLPIILIEERRNGYRASFTKKGLTIRVDKRASQRKRQVWVNLAKDWANKVIARRPEILNKYKKRAYANGDVLKTFDRNLIINRRATDLKHAKAIVEDKTLLLYLPPEPGELSSVVSKALVVEYRPYIVNRLQFFNAFLPVQYKKLSLRYNTSNWGSCSSKGSINISTRVLLTDRECIDYILVHELCHLLHQNHGRSFWAEVERMMPDFRNKHRKLKSYSFKAFL